MGSRAARARSARAAGAQKKARSPRGAAPEIKRETLSSSLEFVGGLRVIEGAVETEGRDAAVREDADVVATGVGGAINDLRADILRGIDVEQVVRADRNGELFVHAVGDIEVGDPLGGEGLDNLLVTRGTAGDGVDEFDIVAAEERGLRGGVDAAVVAQGDGGDFAVTDLAELEREFVNLVVRDEVQHVTRLTFFHTDFFREVEERRGDTESGELRRGGLEFGDLRRAVIGAGGQGEFTELFEIHFIAEGHIDAFGLGVDGVGEVATATDRGQTLRGEEVGHSRAGVIAGEDDAVLDIGAVEIDRGGEVGEGLGGEADALAGGFLGLEV